jgi:hypothetical protein
MSKQTSRKLVIDSSVLQAAGETDHPVSSACRKCLMSVLTICHHYVRTSDIDEERKPHQSSFSRKWWVRMAGRGKLDRGSDYNLPLKMHTFSSSSQDAIKKDYLLLKAAASTDRVIITLDDKLYMALGETEKGIKFRDSLTWIHPVRDGTDILHSL